MGKSYVRQEHIEQVYNSLKRYKKRMNDYPDVLLALEHGKSDELFAWAFPERERKPSRCIDSNRFISGNSLPKMVDLRKLLKCFPGIKLKNGYRLDYVVTAGENSTPVQPYVLRNDENDFSCYEDFEEHQDKQGMYDWKEELTLYIDVLSEPEGYFDLAMFIACIENLYLFGHANYGHLNLLYTEEEIRRVIIEGDAEWSGPYPEEDVKKLKRVDTRPFVEEGMGGKITVSFLAETPWGGIFWHKTKFAKKGPILEYKGIASGRRIIKHNCGIMF